MTKNIEFARNYLLAYESKDLEAISDMINPAVSLQDWNVSGSGESFFIDETKKNFAAADQIEIRILSIQESADVVSAQLEISIDGGRELLNVVDVISFDSNHKILSVRAYKG